LELHLRSQRLQCVRAAGNGENEHGSLRAAQRLELTHLIY
jgi:hypothetical protein